MREDKDATKIIDEIQIIAPCRFGWDNMKGDDKIRFCSGCNQSVYNVSQMTKTEAESFLSGVGKAACLRLYRRADGTLITKDCSVVLRRLRTMTNIIRRVASALILTIVPFFAAKADSPAKKDELGCPSQSSSKTQASKRNLFEVEPVVIDGYSRHASKDQVGEANWDAYNFLYSAEKFANGNSEEADSCYKKALEAAKVNQSDPKFTKTIAESYAAFLKRYLRTDDSSKIIEEYGLTVAKPDSK